MAAAVELDPVAQVRAIWAAYARGGVDALRRVVAPEVEWLPLAHESPLAGEAFWEQWAPRWHDRVSATVHEFELRDECVLAHGSLRTFREGGFVDVQPSWVYFFSGQQLVRCGCYPTREAALDAIAEHRRLSAAA
jgi:ketosteroid isomerase-like protein